MMVTPVRYREAGYYVRIVGPAVPVVQVFAIAVSDVVATPPLLAELNDINADVSFVRVFHVRGQVLVETDLLGEALDPRSFDNACGAVGAVAHQISGRLADRHGGTRVFDGGQGDRRPEPDMAGGFYL